MKATGIGAPSQDKPHLLRTPDWRHFGSTCEVSAVGAVRHTRYVITIARLAILRRLDYYSSM